jgi:hypothetical protein
MKPGGLFRTRITLSPARDLTNACCDKQCTDYKGCNKWGTSLVSLLQGAVQALLSTITDDFIKEYIAYLVCSLIRGKQRHDEFFGTKCSRVGTSA